jgi:hypothetical protein
MIGGILYNQGRPSVIEVFPDPNAVAIPGPAPLRMTFDRPMNPASIASGLETIPARDGHFFWEDNTVTFRPDQPWPAGQVISVTLSSSARSSLSVVMEAPYRWQFTTAPTLLGYLWPSGGPADIYALDPGNGDIIQLSHSELGVLDFSVSTDSLSIYFSARNQAGGADLWHMDMISRESQLLFDCDGDLCTNVEIRSVNELAYENTSLNQVFYLSLDNTTGSLMGAGVRPNWSAQGQLAYFDASEPGFFFRDLETGALALFSNTTGEPGSWSPDGAFFVAPEIRPAGSGTATSHLVLFELLTGSTLDLTQLAASLGSGDINVEDNSPAFSQDGGMIAFARKYLDSERWTPGRQLWIVSPDGAESRPISDSPNFNHSAFTWHPNEPQLAYLRSDQTDPTLPTEIWLTLLDGSGPVRLIIGGFQPTWIP